MARCLFWYNLIVQVLFGLVMINETSPYEKIYLENSQLCSLKDNDTSSVVKLGKGDTSSKAVVHGKYFDRWTGKYSFSCSFSVEAPVKYGIYTVVQNLNFRQDPRTKLCKDYVEIEIQPRLFSIFPLPKPKKISKRFCGKIYPKEFAASKDVNYEKVQNSSLVGENGFVSQDKLIHVKIFIAKEKLKANEKLDIHLVFSAFKKDCNPKKNYFQCRRCEWIWADYLNDKVQNCPYTSCLDEDFCKNIKAENEIQNFISTGTGTKVSIGAAATIILVLLLFACCVWISRRMQLCCYKSPRNRQSRMEMNSREHSTGIEEIPTRFGDMLPQSTAPSAPPIFLDKDLPPSYGSLFPEK